MEEQQTSLALDCEETKTMRDVKIRHQPADSVRMLQEIGDLKILIDQKSKERDEFVKPINLEIKQSEAKMMNIIDTYNAGEEIKNVQVLQKKIFNANAVQYWHEGSMVEERAMTPEERQGSLYPVQEPELADDDADEDATEVDSEPMTQEEAAEDLKQVMRDEKNPNKPNLTT